MVVNPYKANDGRQRIAEPYYSSSVHSGTQRPLLFGALSTRNMIIVLLATIALVSYIFHVHHTFVEDGNVSSVQGSSKLRGSVSSIFKYSLTTQPSLVPTWHPTRQPSFAPTAATTSPRPTPSPTTIQPTATPTPLPTSASVIETSLMADSQRKTDGIDQDGSASSNVLQPTASSQVVPSIANENKEELTSISEDPVNSKDGDGLNEHNDNARAAYLSLLESMKKRPTIGRPGSPGSHIMEKISDLAAHDQEKEQFFPPNRKPELLPPNFEGKSLQVPPQKATASDGMIPFVPEAKPNQIQRLSPPGEEDASNTSLDPTTVESQTPVRMKFDLPSNVQLQSKSRETDPTTSVQSADKVDHCKLQSDPFQSQPIESFVPPTNAPFAKVLEWQTEVKSVLKNIGKMRIGGDKLRQHLQEEVTRLRIKRFNTFCEYL